MGVKIYRLRSADVVKVHKLLEQRFHKGEDKVWRYEPNWDDHRIAAMISPDVRAPSIAKIRRELFGETPRSAKPNGAADLKRRVEALEKRVNELEEAITSNNKTKLNANGEVIHAD